MSAENAMIGEVVHWWRPESTVKGKPRKRPTGPPIPAIITMIHENFREEMHDGRSGKRYGIVILNPDGGTDYTNYTAQSEHPMPGTWTRRAAA